MKKIDHDNFIGIYDGFFSQQFCENLISYFEWCQKTNKVYKRSEIERLKSDLSTNLNPSNIEELNFSLEHVSGYIEEFNKVFWDECYADYLSKFSVLSDYEKHSVVTYKVQKTMPGQGYHIWHAEDDCLQFSRRIGVYTLYLNDIEEGGETEFLYLSKRVAPKQGRLVIFPPNYPWAHRGNPPLSGVKYIMTGWTEFV